MARTSESDAGPPLHVETLDSGLTLLLRELHVAPVAEVQIWAKVGSADERPGEEGLAHFHEHMLFKGTETRGLGDIAGAVEGVGGRINAFTSFDTTCYHATLPAEEVGVGLDVLADAVRHSVFDPEEVAREIEVVLEEINRSDDDPTSVLSDAVFAAAYREHPYRAPILGTRESVANLSREQLRRFYRHWYGPDNLVVVAAGDFDAAALRQRVVNAFAGAAPTGAHRQRPAEPEPDALRAVLLRRPFERACLDLSWRTVAMSHPDAALLDLLAFVLGEGDSSRLVRHVKEEEALADHIDASSYTPVDPGLFSAMAELEPERVEAAVASIVREVELLRSEPVPEEELEKARANFLASKAWERESVGGMARKLGAFHILTGDPAFEEAYLERIRRARPEDLLRAARRWLGEERLTAGACVPEGAAAALDGGVLTRAALSGRDAARRCFRAPRHGPREGTVESYELDNGIRVHVVARREVPVVALRAAVLGGQLAETEETAGLTHFLAGMWLRGTRAHSSADFARRVESLASDIDGFSGRNSAGLTLDATSDRFDAVLELLAEVWQAPAFADHEIERERSDTLAAIARRADRLAPRVFDLFARTHFRHHPYRLPIVGLPETVSRFELADLRAHHARLVRPDRMVVAVVGDVDPDEAAARVSRHLGALPVEGEGFDLPTEEPPCLELREATEHKDRAQAHLVVGFRGLRLDDADRATLDVIDQLLGGQGGRLFLELRDRRSLAYSLTAAHVEGVAPGFFAVYIATAPEKLDEARSGILGELRRLLDEPPSEAELERARRYIVGNHAIDEQRAGNRAIHVALDSLYGLGPDAERHWPEKIRAVTRDDVLRVARTLFRLDHATIAAIRP